MRYISDLLCFLALTKRSFCNSYFRKQYLRAKYTSKIHTISQRGTNGNQEIPKILEGIGLTSNVFHHRKMHYLCLCFCSRTALVLKVVLVLKEKPNEKNALQDISILAGKCSYPNNT